MEVDIGGMSANGKKYLAKIIANDNEGLQVISACCAGAKRAQKGRKRGKKG